MALVGYPGMATQPLATRPVSSSPPVLLVQGNLSRRSVLARDSSYLGAISAFSQRCSLAHCGPRSESKPVSRVRASSAQTAEDAAQSSGETLKITEPVLVVGAGGGVGQLCVAKLLERGVRVRALVRNRQKAATLFADAPEGLLEVVEADLREVDSLKGKGAEKGPLEGVKNVIVCTGTTAFPSKRWDGNNGPEQTDYLSSKNLFAALPSDLERVVLVSSQGVLRFDQFPFNILNLFGVLRYKKMAEDLLQTSGKPFTIIRPGRLTDGPYTSYDLNTLLKATSGVRQSAVVKKGDSLAGETSRILVAEACIQALYLSSTQGEAFEVISEPGDGPGQDPKKWEKLFSTAAKA